MKKKLLLLILGLLNVVYIYADEKLILEAVNDLFISTLNDRQWTLGRSSVLFEQGKDSDFYEWRNLQDSNLNTCWCEGKKDAGIGEYVLIPFSREDGLGFSYRKAQRFKNIVCSLNINNGNCKDMESFMKNNRIKRCRIKVYDTPVIYGQNITYANSTPLLIYDSIIELEDTPDKQLFDFCIKLRDDETECSPLLMIQLIILDVYPGTQYDNTAISEIKVYGEYVDQ